MSTLSGSGRRMFRPLDWWRGERLNVSLDFSEVEIHSGSRNEMANNSLNVKRRAKPSKIIKSVDKVTKIEKGKKQEKDIGKERQKQKSKDEVETKSKETNPVSKVRTKSKTGGEEKSQNQKTDKSAKENKPDSGATKKKPKKSTRTKKTVCDQIIKVSAKKPSRRQKTKASVQETAADKKEKNKTSKPVESKKKKEEKGHLLNKESNEKDNKKRGGKTNGKDSAVNTKSTMNKENGWSHREIKDFKKAFYGIVPTASNFWFLVSTMVGTKTVEECIEFHNSHAPQSTKKKPMEKKIVIVKEPPKITGGKNTLKRKRQLKEFIAHQDVGYEDDFFDSTPYKKMQPSKMPRLADDSFEDYPCNDINFETPAAVRECQMNRMPLSEKKTPNLTTGFTPGVMERLDDRAIDQYVHRMKHGRNLKPLSLMKHQTPVGGFGRSMQRAPIMESVGPIATLFQNPVQHQGDEDSEEDYYFSDKD